MSDDQEIPEPEIDYLAHPYGVEAVGPFIRDEYDLTVDGYQVPYIQASKLETGDYQWTLRLDRRYAIDCTDLEMRKWLWFIADAMAVAAGYSSHGRHCKPLNPFKHRMIGITSVETEGDKEQP